MATKVYEVMKKDDKWIVRIKGNTKVIKSFATKPEAQEFVEGLSERQDGSYQIRASKGKNKGRFIQK